MVEKLFETQVEDQYWFAHLVVNIKNTTGKDIDWIKIWASFKNNFWEQVFASISREKYFYWIWQDVLKNWQSDVYNWQLSLFDNTAK